MPGSSFRPRAADVVRPGGNGCQIVVAQKLPQLLYGGLVQVLPGDIGNDPVTFVSPRQRLGMGKYEYESGYCRKATSNKAETHSFDDSLTAFRLPGLVP